METPVRCQLFHSNETSPFAACCVAPRIGLAHFRGLVERFAPKFRAGGIRYFDDEGDQITIETDIELEEALKLGQKLGVLKVVVDAVKVEIPDPAPSPAPAVQVPVKEEPQVVPPATPAPKVVHRAICDNCRKYIAGIRYKCINCPDYDLCEPCEELFGKQEGIHPQDHVFLKIRRPICPHHRLAIPNLYEPAVRRPCIANRRCAFPRASVTVNAAPAPAPAPATATPNNHEERISVLEATVSQLAQELSTVTDEKKKIEERKKAQEQKRKELKEQLQKKNEERAAIKAERKLKKAQQMEANRVAAQARQAARQAKQVAVAQTRTVIEVPVKVEAVPTPAPVQEPAKVEEVVEVKVAVSEPVQIVHVEEIPQQEEEKAQEQQEAAEEEKKDDDFVVISEEEAPAEEDERRSYFKEALEILAGMGFSDIDRNLHLLAHFAGDVHAVITALLEVA